jgi:long-chain acyl-CoA synthetase
VASLAEWAARRPDDPAVVTENGARTFAELDGAANRLARALRRRGLVPGDAVALVCGNRPEFAEVYYACQHAGFRLTPVNWHLTAAEVGYIVDNCEARALIAEEAFVATAAAARRTAARCEIGIAIGAAADGCESYREVVADESAGPLDDPAPGGTMLYTSGTTGRPKGVHRPPGATSALTAVNLFGYDEDGGDRHLCTGPLYHAAPLAFSLAVPIAFGATVVVMETWDAQRALDLIDEHRITHTHMVPTMFHRLLSVPEEARMACDTGALRHVIHGAAPCPTSVKHGMIEWLGPVVWEYYAATEGVASFVDSPTWLEHPGTVGRPIAADQVVVGDEEGRPLAVGEIGLVYIKAVASARFSYFKDDAKTSSAYRGDYFTLGDLGYLDEDGFLYLTDRSSNLIISGGVNIYPAEVDAVLIDHPAVADVATIGVPDEEWGESVLAVVELRAGHAPSDELADALIAHCRGAIAHYKCPRAVEFVDALPRGDNGKIYKRLLRDQVRAAEPRRSPTG